MRRAVRAGPEQADRLIRRDLLGIDAKDRLAEVRSSGMVQAMHRYRLWIMVDGDINRPANTQLYSCACSAPAGEQIDEQLLAKIQIHLMIGCG